MQWPGFRFLIIVLISSGAIYCQTPYILNTDINQLDAGGSSFVNRVNGDGFVAGSIAYWERTPLATTFVSSSQLSIVIPAGLIATSGKYPVTVRNPNGGVSNAFPVYVEPVLTSIFPTSAPLGAQSATIVANGIGFTPSDVFFIMASSTHLSTTYVNSTTLSAILPAAMMAKSAVISFSVADVNAGLFSRQQLLFTIGTPPFLRSLSPSSALMGSPALTLTINGTGFLPGALAYYNGFAIPTVFVSPTQLTATLQESLLTQPGSAPGLVPIWVVNPEGGLSNTLRFTVSPPTPVVVSLTPESVIAGGPSFTVTVNGANFFSDSRVWFNGSPVTTTYISSGQLTATVPANLISSIGNADVYVINTGFEAPYSASNHVSFAIKPPSLNSLTPPSVKAGSLGFPLTANGSDFLPGASIRWNGSMLATSYISPTQLSAPVDESLVASTGRAAVTVVNPGANASNVVNFVVGALLPSVSGVTPASVTAGSAAFTLTVRGLNFVAGATVRWNVSPLVTTFLTESLLTATVPANLIASPVAVAISVMTSGGLSNPVAFTVTAPVPTAGSAGVVNAASSLPSIAPGSLITIYGTNLGSEKASADSFPLLTALKGTSITINDQPAPLLYVSPNQINAQVPFEVLPGTAVLVISANGSRSGSISFGVTSTAPGTLMLPGSNHAVAQNLPDGVLNSPASPALPGQYITAYLTGQGLLDNAVATGSAAPTSPLSVPTAPVRVQLGGQTAEILFAGLVPGYAGLMQINLKLPLVGPGEQLFEVSIGGVASNTTTLSIASRLQ